MLSLPEKSLLVDDLIREDRMVTVADYRDVLSEVEAIRRDNEPVEETGATIEVRNSRQSNIQISLKQP